MRVTVLFPSIDSIIVFICKYQFASVECVINMQLTQTHAHSHMRTHTFDHRSRLQRMEEMQICLSAPLFSQTANCSIKGWVQGEKHTCREIQYTATTLLLVGAHSMLLFLSFYLFKRFRGLNTKCMFSLPKEQYVGLLLHQQNINVEDNESRTSTTIFPTELSPQQRHKQVGSDALREFSSLKYLQSVDFNQ